MENGNPTIERNNDRLGGFEAPQTRRPASARAGNPFLFPQAEGQTVE